MISKNEFESLITEHKNQVERVNSLCKIFSCAFADPIIDWGFILFDNLINIYFDEIGADWVSYYLNENSEQCYYQNDERIPLETIDDLWILVEEHRK